MSTSQPPLLRYTSLRIRWTKDEQKLFQSKCDHYAATHTQEEGQARVISEELGNKLRENAQITDKMTEKQIQAMDKAGMSSVIIIKWFYNNWRRWANPALYIPPPPKNPAALNLKTLAGGKTSAKGKARQKLTASSTLESQARDLARELWSNADSSWEANQDRYIASGSERGEARTLAILHCFANLSDEERESWVDSARAKIEEMNRPLTKEEIASQKTAEIPDMLDRCLTPYEESSGNFFLVHYFNSASRSLKVWSSPTLVPMTVREDSRTVSLLISKLIQDEYADQLVPEWACDGPPKPEVYRDPNSAAAFYPRLPGGVDDTAERRRHLALFLKLVLGELELSSFGHGSNEPRVPYTRIQAEHAVSNYCTVASHYLVPGLPFRSPHEMKAEQLNQVWDEYLIRQTRGQLPLMYQMVICDSSTQTVAGYQMFITYNVDEDETTIFYPTPIKDLPFGNRVNYGEESEAYSRWLLQVIPETDVEYTGGAEEPESPVPIPSAESESDIEIFTSDEEVDAVEPVARSTRPDVEEDAPTVQKTAGVVAGPLSDATSAIQEFSDSEVEDAEITITQEVEQPSDEAPVSFGLTVTTEEDPVPLFPSPVETIGRDVESPTLNMALFDNFDPAETLAIYDAAVNTLVDENTRAELMGSIAGGKLFYGLARKSVLTATDEAFPEDAMLITADLDTSNPTPLTTMASLENAYLNLDDPPTLVKPCPEDWSETM
ncbi:hypothetical protein FRC10_004943, partial [Ceratobasidium sp. 414]